MRRLTTSLVLFIFLLVLSVGYISRAEDMPNISGEWSGPWENTRGEKGNSPLTISETGGVITGIYDGWQIVDGRLSGNTATWIHRNAASDCRDYQVRAVFSKGGSDADINYSAIDRCRTPSTYSGTHHLTKK